MMHSEAYTARLRRRLHRPTPRTCCSLCIWMQYRLVLLCGAGPAGRGPLPGEELATLFRGSRHNCPE